MRRDEDGIAACASACVPPSRLLCPNLLANPLDRPLRCLPQMGERGRCASGAVPGHMGVPNRLEALAASRAARGSE
jgi:hypothetical protein